MRPCGTMADYTRHRRHGEEPCPACKEAKRLQTAERRAKKRAQAKAVAEGRPTPPARPVRREKKPYAVKASEECIPATTFPAAPPKPETFDRLEYDRLHENLNIVDHALFEASPGDVARLSKRRQEIEEAIFALLKRGKKKGGNALDELARRRAQRPTEATA